MYFEPHLFPSVRDFKNGSGFGGIWTCVIGSIDTPSASTLRLELLYTVNLEITTQTV